MPLAAGHPIELLEEPREGGVGHAVAGILDRQPDDVAIDLLRRDPQRRAVRRCT